MFSEFFIYNKGIEMVDFNTAIKNNEPIDLVNTNPIELVALPYYVYDALVRRKINLEELSTSWEKVIKLLPTQDILDISLANDAISSIFNCKFKPKELPIDNYNNVVRYEDLYSNDDIRSYELTSFINTLSENNFKINMSNIDITIDGYEFKICNDVVYLLLKGNFFNGMKFGASKFRMKIIKDTLNYLFSQLPNDRVFKSRIFKAAIQFFN